VVTRRIECYARLGTALARDQAEEADRLTNELAATPDVGVYAAPLDKIVSEEMRSALKRLHEAETEAHALLVRTRPSAADFASPSFQARLLQVGDRVTQARVRSAVRPEAIRRRAGGDGLCEWRRGRRG
jgi:hypothetical protein